MLCQKMAPNTDTNDAKTNIRSDAKREVLNVLENDCVLRNEMLTMREFILTDHNFLISLEAEFAARQHAEFISSRFSEACGGALV